jgi:uncharacterized protein
MAETVMLIPSLACPARCLYCFSPHGSGLMSLETLKAAAEWIGKSYFDCDRLDIVFHGGEPLCAGASFFAEALSILSGTLSKVQHRFTVQTNLWLLDDELCSIFREYGVSIGTSIDGPREINDRQRGAGYFDRCMSGIRLARKNGLNPGAICTFTEGSAEHVEEIYRFFLREELDLTVHGAVPALPDFCFTDRRADDGSVNASNLYSQPLDAAFSDQVQPESASSQPCPENSITLSPGSYGDVLIRLLGLYRDNIEGIRITTLDHMMKSLRTGTGGVCTFCDCLGHYIAIGPEGSIYPCQRFAGNPAYSAGNVKKNPDLQALCSFPAWEMIRIREERIGEECGSCPYLAICRGGCPYNALAAGRGKAAPLKDPYCETYRQVFKTLGDSALEEIFSEENINTIVEEQGESIYRKGRLISIANGSPHPAAGRRRAMSIIYAAALGADKEKAAEKLWKAGAASSAEHAEMKLESLLHRLRDMRPLNNIYIHVTFDCNLRCSHCYADAGREGGMHMSVDDMITICREASKLGFRQAVLTGGEPLTHPQREKMLEALRELRESVRPMTISLRTNLSLPMDDRLKAMLAESADQIAVSLDGDRGFHDQRRGAGSFDRTVGNLEALTALGYGGSTSITAVMSVKDAAGSPGRSLQELADKLGISRLHFKPLLPLGRAGEIEMEIVPEAHWAFFRLEDAVSYGFTPALSCGFGHNLYVEPDGSAFPCYACKGKEHLLGRVGSEGSLTALIRDGSFRELMSHTVDSDRRCGKCSLRYLCGGACRAWGLVPALIPETEGKAREESVHLQKRCGNLYKRAASLLEGALRYAGIAEERWLDAGLPVS